VVAKQRVGSSFASHLAAISSSGVQPGATIVHYSNPVIYYPVSNNSFKEFEVCVADRAGEPVKFCGGNADQVSVQLHFRPRPYGI
jgi:hypothetical protein